ncbi:hypothetical protein PC41400_21720 [Paenibacillus chitinolyticus]|uniref:Uncharacterized protein n=1 Tax=Paenibacillus chitinolyticus TaxID=79263 RepID=A0A410X0Y3_9BACL|nr:hypothetical protein [Paenibacillus chitinolyticus]MCY9593752.1 hypothetical protein [Paenibacillus chitinolyticus]MCY9599683.1 hypothetical protein [Paenibacillus chitinolyticus]QAV20141.1 hypothetical protein PC41400_21720 [Paenibacillus chitinolyticus]
MTAAAQSPYARMGNTNKRGKAVIGGKKHDRRRIENKVPVQLGEFVELIQEQVIDLDYTIRMLFVELIAQGFADHEVIMHSQAILLKAIQKASSAEVMLNVQKKA